MNKYLDSLTSWDEFEKTLGLTDEEITEIDLKVQIVGEIINARRGKEITQQALEELSGVRQPVIARLENNDTDPRLTTVLKLLLPLGKTLQVVDLPNAETIENNAEYEAKLEKSRQQLLEGKVVVKNLEELEDLAE